jgi:hypothetical protein
MTDIEPKVVRLPGTPKRAVKRGDEKLAADIRAAYVKLCRCIEAARDDGLCVDCTLDASDTYYGSNGERVRLRPITVTRKL